MGPLSDIKRKYGNSYIWMCRYFCYVMMVGMRLCKVVDALSNILGGGATCIELCTVHYAT